MSSLTEKSAEKRPKCVVLLSGGLDSATCFKIAQSLGFDIYALTVSYGQRHSAELTAAKTLSAKMEAAEHKLINVNLDAIGGSALTDEIAVPKDRKTDEIGIGIPITYVPARNTILLSLALAYAEVIHSNDIFIGVNAIDYSGYPDCRPEYIRAFQNLAKFATQQGIEGNPPTIHTPLIDLSKAQIIRRGLDLGVDFSLTLSCYDPTPDGTPCIHCDACLIRAKAFAEIGIEDPAISK